MVGLNRDKVRRVFAAVDWGYTNPGVIQVWALDTDERMYLVHEVYQTQQLIGWWVGRATAIQDHYQTEAFVCDPAEPAYIQEFRRAGLHAIEGYNEIARGIQAVQERWKVRGDGKPGLIIMADCCPERDESLAYKGKPTCTAQEIPGYIWPKDMNGRPVKEVPVDMDNHGCDTLRYAVCYADRIGRSVAGVLGNSPRPDKQRTTPRPLRTRREERDPFAHLRTMV